MAKEFDVVVYGASGVTGKFIIEEMAIFGKKLTWAVAGRQEDKLRSVLHDVGETTGEDLSDVNVILADSTQYDKLVEMCSKAKLLLNCVGPYRFHGQPVVEACIESGTHYVDVCGEPQFLETIQVKHFDGAKENAVYIVGSCGFDSMPCDMGVDYLKQNFRGHVNAVESYLELNMAKDSKANFATWQSAIYSFLHISELKDLRRKLMEKLFTKGRPKSDYPIKERPVLFKSDVVGKWCLPFFGSDRSVVARSQMYKYQFEDEKPTQIHTYFCVPSLFRAWLFMFLFMTFSTLIKFKCGRYLLEKYPGFFSFGVFTKKPIKREQAIGSSFRLTLLGTGWEEGADESQAPQKKKTVTVTGPDPGYVTTSICAVAACMTLLDNEEKEKMPKGGGVFSPAAAFAKTKLAEKLEERGLVMKVVDDKEE